MQVFLLELLPFNSLDSYAPQACEILFNPLNRALRTRLRASSDPREIGRAHV